MLKPMLFAAASIVALQATPATAAVNFTVTKDNPAGFGANVTGFYFTFSAQSAVATTLDIILSAYDRSDCYSVDGIGCAFYDRNRREVTTIAINPGFNSYDGSISIGTGPGPVTSISVLFSTPSTSPIVVTNFDTEFADLVPEPSTWAMMLVGFGAIGFAMRRRSTKVSYA